VLSWALMVADGVLVAVVFIQLARIDLLANSSCTCRHAAKVAPAIIACALVRVGTGVRAAAMCSTGVVDAVPDVVALFTVAIESRRAFSTHVSLTGSNDISARHASETWII